MNTALVTTQQTEVMPRQADSDSQLIALWLHDKGAHSRRAYMADIKRFLNYVNKPLAGV